MALARKLGRDDSYIQKRLPMAQGQQYLCALAIANGAVPVWADMHKSTEDIIERSKELLSKALKQVVHEFQNTNS